LTTSKLNSSEIEIEILGIILSDSKSIETAIGLLNPDCFYSLCNKTIYQAMLHLYSENKPIDVVNLYEYGNKSRLKNILAISSLISSPLIMENRCKILVELWMKRQIIKSLNEALKNAKDEDPFELLNSMSDTIYRIENHLQSLSEEKTMYNDLDKVFSDIIKKMRNKEPEGLMSKTFPSLNNATGGIMPTDYVIIYGAYKAGKSTVAEQIMLDVALNTKAVGLFSLEMSKTALYHKALSMRTGIDYMKLRNPKHFGLSDEELKSFAEKTREVFSKTKIYIADKIFDIDQIIAKMKLWKRKYKIELFVVDYIGLLESSRNYEKRYLAIGDFSRKMKNTAKMLEVPIIAVSQANDDNKTAESKNPARDADFVISVIKPFGTPLKNIKKKNGSLFTFDESHFLITLENSRHGLNRQNFVAGFVNNNFVELDLEGVDGCFI